MEEEISLKEILIVLWRGKYIILAVTVSAIILALIVSFVIITPLYEASARIDLTHYQLERSMVMEFIEEPGWVEIAIQDLVENPDKFVNNVDFPKVYDDSIHITVRAEDKDKARQAIQIIGAALILQINEKWSVKLKNDIDFLEGKIDRIDQQLVDRINEFYEYDFENINLYQESLEFSLGFIEDYITELYGDLSPEKQQIIIKTDPTYKALFESKEKLIIDFLESELFKEKIKQGRITEYDLRKDPVYLGITKKKNDLLIELNDTVSHLGQLKQQDYIDQENIYLFDEKASNQPVNLNWRLNALLAGVLGLIVSTVIVFVKPYLGEVIAEIVKSDQDIK